MKGLNEKQKKWIERTVANDRSYKVLLYNRFFLVLLFVLAQLVGYGILLLAFAYDSQVGVFVQLVVFILELIFILQIISDTLHPSTKLNWVIVILIFPIFGVPMYVFNASGKPIKRMQKSRPRAAFCYFTEYSFLTFPSKSFQINFLFSKTIYPWWLFSLGMETEPGLRYTKLSFSTQAGT